MEDPPTRTNEMKTKWLGEHQNQIPIEPEATVDWIYATYSQDLWIKHFYMLALVRSISIVANLLDAVWVHIQFHTFNSLKMVYVSRILPSM